jgi:dynactin complex subunit
VYSFDIGDRVLTPSGKMGVLKYLGAAENYSEVVAGIVLDRPAGDSDGSMNVRSRFTLGKGEESNLGCALF